MTLYVRSTNVTGGSGSSWATAKVTLQAASQADNAPEIVYVSQAHSESTAASIFMAWGGLINAPVSVICANDTAEPPVSSTSGPVVNVTGANAQIQISGNVYVYGLNVRNNGTATCETWLTDANVNAQLWSNCVFEVNSATAARLTMNTQSNSSGEIRWVNTDLKFGGTSDAYITAQNEHFIWNGGTMIAGVTPQPGLFFTAGFKFPLIEMTGVDFSQMDPSFYIMNTQGGGRVVMRDCKMPAGWTGGFYSGALGFNFRGEMYNCAAGATSIGLVIQEHMGKIESEPTLVRATGANDGVTSYSHKFSANGDCNYYYSRLRGPESFIWNDLTSASITLTVDILHDSLTPLTNRDIAVEVTYMGDSASPKATVTNSFPSNVLATGTNLTSSSAQWVTTGLTNPNKQKVSVAFTPMQRGILHVRLLQTLGSYTLYVDPKPQVV